MKNKNNKKRFKLIQIKTLQNQKYVIPQVSNVHILESI